MKIVILNWAPIWRGAHLGGGVNGYLNALAPELAANGHDVTAISAGLLHTRHPQGCLSRRHDDFRGVRVIEIINSPVLAPAAAQFREPMSEVSAPELETELERLLMLIKPDIAHWHNIEGFSAGCIDICRRVGAKVVYSLHNYHTLCSQVTLCKGHEKPCHNFDSGHACSTCIDAPDPYSERLRRQDEFVAGQESSRLHLEKQRALALAHLKHELSWPKRIVHRTYAFMNAHIAVRRAGGEHRAHTLPGKAIESPIDLAVDPVRQIYSLPLLDTDRLGQAYAARAGPALTNEAHRDPSSDRLLGAHARRRAAMVSMLNRCDKVLAVSDFVRMKYVAEGVDSSRIITQHIGTSCAEHTIRGFSPNNRTNTLRLVFLGFNHFNKGLPLLLTALQGMPGEALRQISLSIYAPGVQSIGPSFRKLHPPLSELHIRDRYERTDLPSILGGHDLCYVGSSWWDPLPQTVLESLSFGVPVLGAQAGGIPDAVQEGKNGFLFRANDPAALRRRIQDALECFGTDNWPSEIDRPKSIPEHSRELIDLYRSLVQLHDHGTSQDAYTLPRTSNRRFGTDSSSGESRHLHSAPSISCPPLQTETSS